MRELVIVKKEIDPTEYIKRSALAEDCSTFIDESVKILDEQGNIKILYFKIPKEVDTEAMRWAVKNIKYDTSKRVGGLKSTSAIFGYSPRNTRRKDFCSATAMATKYPKQHQVICDFAEQLSDIYKEHIPDVYFEHEEITDVKVKKRMEAEKYPFHEWDRKQKQPSQIPF